MLAWAVLVATACVLATAVVLLFPYPVVLLLERLWPAIHWRKRTDARTVTLSVDDGPDPEFTPQLLGILRQRHVVATFFLVGDRVRRYPELAAQICREGHEIGNHSDTWARTVGVGVRQFEEDLVRSEVTLQAYPCFRKMFRPAGVMVRGAHLDVLKKRGYICVLGSAYAFDPYRPPARFIAWAISRALRPGAIIVVHDSGGDRTETIVALPHIIDAAQRRGLAFIPLSRLLTR